ncbi:hypothetical protein [Desulfogranum mediterraneum]|uniref:hypothetical protein n=1 Tax=Desulfogranum mediterraneum TaxID=160661 RepID=UPI00040B02D0|nr:hypothetical protein [Desulfogranum mediterraneum]
MHTRRPAHWTFTLSLMLIFCLPLPAGSEPSRLYRQQTGDQIQEFSWELNRQEELVVITSREEDGKYSTTCTQDGNTLLWSYSKGQRQLTVRRAENILQLSGRDGKTQLSRTIPLDHRPWYQALSYSLRTLILGTTEEVSFWMIRPDNLEPVRLEARKKECESLEWAEQEVPACRVEVSTGGLMASFWHASYWFRQSDAAFIHYQSVHGLPGTPPTTIRLIREGLSGHPRG